MGTAPRNLPLNDVPLTYFYTLFFLCLRPANLIH